MAFQLLADAQGDDRLRFGRAERTLLRRLPQVLVAVAAVVVLRLVHDQHVGLIPISAGSRWPANLGRHDRSLSSYCSQWLLASPLILPQRAATAVSGLGHDCDLTPQRQPLHQGCFRRLPPGGIDAGPQQRRPASRARLRSVREPADRDGHHARKDDGRGPGVIGEVESAQGFIPLLF